ncbi:MAG: restriction endonuclease subunit S [Nitrospira sp.]|nr:MAG: restriction endonuclease subunit S [Nitrospira sp.]
MKKGWATKTLGEVLQKTETVNPLQSPQVEFDYIDVSSVSNTTFQIEATQRLKGKDAPSRARKLVRANDVLFATIRPTLKRIAVVPEHLDKQVCSTGYFVLRPKPEIDHRFVFYSLFTENFMGQMESLQKGASYPAVTDGEVKAQLIPVPSLSEQQRIVGLLDDAFEGIATAKANAEKNLHNARALFESHLQSVFTQRGDGWVKKRLDEVCTFSSGGTPFKSNSSYWSGEIPWVSGRDMKSTRLSDSLLHISRSAVDESSTRMAPAGALLILVRGMGLAHGAQIAELMVPCAFNQDIRGIHPEPDLIPRYLLFALRDRINSSDTVLSNAAHGTLKIDSDELQSVMIPVPPHEHQQRIVTTIDSLTEETQRLESLCQQKLAALDALKKSLLHQAFAGAL